MLYLASLLNVWMHSQASQNLCSFTVKQSAQTAGLQLRRSWHLACAVQPRVCMARPHIWMLVSEAFLLSRDPQEGSGWQSSCTLGRESPEARWWKMSVATQLH